MLLAACMPLACGGQVDPLADESCPTIDHPAQPSPSPAPTSTSTSTSRANPSSQTIDPAWQRTNEHILAPSQPSPDLEYYAANTYPLFDEDNSPAGSSFTWTTDAWNGGESTDMPVDGSSIIANFVPNDTWFWTYDRAQCSSNGTTYWLRANVDLGPRDNVASVELSDKYHPGRIAVNDGLIVFVNGAPQPVMPNVAAAGSGDPRYGTGLVRDDSETGWTFDALSIPVGSLHDGSNEIAIMFDERCGDGGLGHLVLTVEATS
jgi:hypothetical protein